MSAILAGNGILISRSLYHPWGTTRYSQGTSPTDYAYTGQMQEGDIYFYNARWPKVPATQWRGYDPAIGRFMQADTFVPTSQGTQGFDRYAYINNNPVNGTDPSGHCIFGIDTAICIAVGSMVVGALADYGYQVYRNMQSGMEFKEALTTDISAGEIIGGAIVGGFAITTGLTAVTTATAVIDGMKLADAACADGDCTNEIRMLAESSYNTVDDVANSQLGQTIAKSFTHNPSASTVSIGSGKYYTVVGEQMNWTYFSTSTRAWKVFQNLPSHIFDGVNTAFMQQQMSQGKEFVSSISDFPGRGYLMEKSLLHLWGYIENVVVKQSTIFRLPK